MAPDGMELSNFLSLINRLLKIPGYLKIRIINHLRPLFLPLNRTEGILRARHTELFS